MTIFFFA